MLFWFFGNSVDLEPEIFGKHNFSDIDIVSLLKLRCPILFWEPGIITPEKELKVSVAGGTQPLVLAKEEDVATKRSKPTEDNKFCHEQVNVFSFSLYCVNMLLLLLLLLPLIILEPPNHSMLLKCM